MTSTVAAVLVGICAASPVNADPARGPLPVPFSVQAGVLAMLDPMKAPPGANDWSCKPSPARPRPVVLVNSSMTTQALAWPAGAPLLANAGYCVYTFNFGDVTGNPHFPLQALGDTGASAGAIADMVDRVLAATGADKVDIVGHSQGGGIAADYYLKILGGAEKVHTKVGISPSTGTTFSTIAYFRSLVPLLGPAIYGSVEQATPGLIQQVYDSDVVRLVYPHGAESIPGVHLVNIVTEFDQVVTPYTRQFYSGPDVTNILLQAGCPQDRSEHVATLYSERSLRYALHALEDPVHPAPVPCFPVAPYAPWVT